MPVGIIKTLTYYIGAKPVFYTVTTDENGVATFPNLGFNTYNVAIAGYTSTTETFAPVEGNIALTINDATAKNYSTLPANASNDNLYVGYTPNATVTTTYAPFHFVSSENDFGETDMVVVVSQSGYSLNALDAIKVIEAKGRRCIGLTGDVNSDLGKVCDVVANYGVGRETVAYVTRGVTTLALFFMLFAVEAAVRLGIKTAAEGEAVKQQLLKAADINAAVQAQTPSFIKEHYRQLSGMTNAYVCGVGANLGTASEGALKFGETVSIPTAVYEVEEYIHGPNIQMTPRYSVFLIDGGEGTERIHRIFEGTQIVTDNVFLLTRCADYKDEHNVMYVPMDVPEEITPLCWLPFFQMTACQLTNDLDRWNKHPL